MAPEKTGKPNGKKIGLFGGSFDPPHCGHMALAQAGLAMGLDEVWVIPALPVHRQLSGYADAATRLHWLQQMFAEQPDVHVWDWEISQGKATAAVQTLRQFQRLHAPLVPWLMLGADAWAGLPTWREYPAHLELCNVAVFARQGVGLDALPSHADWQQLQAEYWAACSTAGHCCYVPAALPDVSATRIRQQAKEGVSLAGQVPAVIRPEIEKSYAAG